MFQGDNILLVIALIATVGGIYFHYRHLKETSSMQTNSSDSNDEETILSQ